jgi:hypothetical protein
MSKLNTPPCGIVTGGNTGIPACDFTPGRIIGIILTPKGREYTKTETDDFVNKLSTFAQGDRKDRVYPVFTLGTITDNSEEPVYDTLGIGYQVMTSEGAYNYTFPLVEGGLCYAAAVRKLNGRGRYDAILVYDNGLAATRAASGNVKGFTVSEFSVLKPVAATDSTVARFNVNIQFPNPREFIDNVVYLATDDDIKNAVKGILDYEMIIASATATVVTLDIVAKCSRQSLLDTYGTEIASPTLWSQATAAVIDSDGKLKLTGTFTSGQALIPPTTAQLIAAGIGGAPENAIEIAPATITI